MTRLKRGPCDLYWFSERPRRFVISPEIKCWAGLTDNTTGFVAIDAEAGDDNWCWTVCVCVCESVCMCPCVTVVRKMHNCLLWERRERTSLGKDACVRTHARLMLRKRRHDQTRQMQVQYASCPTHQHPAAPCHPTTTPWKNALSPTLSIPTAES